MTGFYEETISCTHRWFYLGDADGINFNYLQVTGKEHRVKEFQVQVKITPLSLIDNIELTRPDFGRHINFK